MKTLITVTRVGDSIRISKVTPHGEEIIEADAEARALAVLLWGRLSQEEPTHGTPLLPWEHIGKTLVNLTSAVERLTARIESNTHALNVAATKPAPPTKPTPVARGQ